MDRSAAHLPALPQPKVYKRVSGDVTWLSRPDPGRNTARREPHSSNLIVGGGPGGRARNPTRVRPDLRQALLADGTGVPDDTRNSNSDTH